MLYFLMRITFFILIQSTVCFSLSISFHTNFLIKHQLVSNQLFTKKRGDFFTHISNMQYSIHCA